MNDIRTKLLAIKSRAIGLTWRRGLGLADDELLIGGVGRLIEAKSFDLLLRAADQLCRRDRRYRFVIVGDPNHNDHELLRLQALR